MTAPARPDRQCDGGAARGLSAVRHSARVGRARQTEDEKSGNAKERIKALLNGVTKYDLQDRAKVRRLVRSAAAILNEPLTSDLEERIIAFVIAQRIDPNNTLHLLRLWSMFR